MTVSGYGNHWPMSPPVIGPNPKPKASRKLVIIDTRCEALSLEICTRPTEALVTIRLEDRPTAKRPTFRLETSQAIIVSSVPPQPSSSPTSITLRKPRVSDSRPMNSSPDRAPSMYTT